MNQLGPLWPDGPPEWWDNAYAEMRKVLDEGEAETSGDAAAYVEFEPGELLLDPGSATPEEIAGLFSAASTIYEMIGGKGLKFTVEDCHEPQFEEELQ